MPELDAAVVTVPDLDPRSIRRAPAGDVEALVRDRAHQCEGVADGPSNPRLVQIADAVPLLDRSAVVRIAAGEIEALSRVLDLLPKVFVKEVR